MAENKKARTSQCRLGNRCGVFYALIAGLLEVGVIVPIVVRAQAVAGCGDGGAGFAGGEVHGLILLHSGIGGKYFLASSAAAFGCAASAKLATQRRK